MFYLIYFLFELLPVVFYLSFLKRNRKEGLQVIFIYCLSSLAMEFAAPMLSTTFKISNFYLYASFTIIEYSLLTLFLFRSLQRKRPKSLLVIGSVVFFVTTIANFWHNGSTTSFDSLSASMEAILIIIYSLLFLYEQITDPSLLFVYTTKKFWVVVAFFIYFSSTLFLFLYAATFTSIKNNNYWYINNIFDIIKNILFCIAFYMKKREKTDYEVESLYADL